MKFLLTTLTIVLALSKFGTTVLGQQFNRNQFYNAMAKGNVQIITDMEFHLLNVPLDSKEGFEGALQMKKAHLVKTAAQKISLFKAGYKKLEHSIKIEPNNAELRFLRLMIQENAPKSVKYKGEITADSQYLIQHFKSLSPEVQKALLVYTKNSKVLKPEYF